MAENKDFLNTRFLPKYNCSNCEWFVFENVEIFDTKDSIPYAKECRGVVHPLQDCVLRGFKAHSDQPGFSQTLNK